MPKTSPIDAHLKLLGVASDAEVAKLAGVSASAVYQYRRYRGIGVVKRSASVKTAPPRPSVPTSTQPTKARRSKLDGFVDLIGVLTDAEVARRAGVTREGVRQYKRRRGLTARPAVAEPVVAVAAAPVVEKQPRGERLCWRVSLREGGTTHLAATSAIDAARVAHAALGDRAVGIERLGVLFP